MTTKAPRESAGTDAAALARELVSHLEAIATPPPGGAFRAAPERAGPATPTDLATSLDGPRAILENGARFVAPYLPAESRFRSLKALVLRALRIVTRDQTVFNSAVLEALRSALLETERGLADVARLAADAGSAARESRDHADRRADAVAEALDERLGRTARALRDELSRETAAREREAAARDALGHEVVASQERIAALERSRDAGDQARQTLDARIGEEERRVAALEPRVSGVSEDLRQTKLEWATLRSRLSGLAASTSPGAPASAAVTAAAGGALAADDPYRAGLYADFERRFRGAESEIRERQRQDVELFRGAPGPIVDLGCGRGELLELLREAGLPAAGCDANGVMAARAREKGLDVDEADLFSWLGAKADASLGGVTAYQVVEHLQPSALVDLVELAIRKLAPGGRILFETINPESVYAMKWFWMDLTHVRPIPAPSLAHLLTAGGLRDVTVDWRSPVPASDSIPMELLESPGLAPVARLLFGPQDYAVTGVK